ncbi:unnamed protein product [Bursaphelenchus okinawaensis]|uniref:UPAR/Ly6 domain-containing protein n=1 Tax=Bursaphelenchus okinawaensis TaxID=465554 RepID=A0A811K6P0_9BILA|nr:unnamed protein product [Bursaphelenchus okinawaensis]CAG9093366.1 unnamed protein product [Bursaphelenchus okinawaensis]
MTTMTSLVKMWKSCSLFLFCFFTVQAAGIAKRMCYQCHMPFQCSTGFCYGDFCVKSLVGDKYVSKGCENKTVKATISGEDAAGSEVGCLESEVFGVPNTVCYCNDIDFCNSASEVSVSLLLVTVFIFCL